jgi:acylphosphatase
VGNLEGVKILGLSAVERRGFEVMERRHIEFQGRVQGVGFRATARDIASRHPVTGWVQNQPDGGVTLELQGDAPAVDTYLNDLRATMGRLITTEHTAMMPIDPHERGFQIRR